MYTVQHVLRTSNLYCDTLESHLPLRSNMVGGFVSVYVVVLNGIGSGGVCEGCIGDSGEGGGGGVGGN